MGMNYNISKSDGEDTGITVFLDDKQFTATPAHANFQNILAYFRKGGSNPKKITELFDVGSSIAPYFDMVSERVTIRNGAVFFDGDRQEDELATLIVSFYEAKLTFRPLVNFMEKLATNPLEHSRRQLFDWLRKASFGIAEDGDVIGWKGVALDAKGGFRSTSSGHAFVNGVEFRGHIPTNPGSVVEMPRSEVQHDPSNPCSTGLHVGTRSYAHGFGSVVVRVKFNPRDVVSVPSHDHSKLRCSRYHVLDREDKYVGDQGALLQTNDDLRLRAVEAVNVSAKTTTTIGRGDPKISHDKDTHVQKLVDDAKATAAKEAQVQYGPDVVVTGKVIKKATAKTVTPVKKAVAKKTVSKRPTKKVEAPKAPARKVTKAAPKPPKFYEDFHRNEFAATPYATLRWLAKEWDVVGLGGTPAKSELVAALTKKASARRGQITRKAKGYKRSPIKKA